MKTAIKGKGLDGATKQKKLSKIGEFLKNGKPLIVVYDIRAVNK